MPGWWILAILLFLVAIAALTASALLGAKTRLTWWAITATAGLFGVIFTLISAYDRVDTRNVGIITEFGKPVGVHGAGIVWHAPWRKVSELSEAIQLQAFESNSYDDASQGKGANNNPAAINVRLANNSNAYVDENLNWRLREGAAPKLFQDYGGANVFQTIKEQLVDRQAQVALSKVFATFNPQVMLAAAANAPGGAAQMPAPAQGADLPAMAAQVKKDLQDAVGSEIEILDVRIPRIFYDQPTQQRIDAYNQKVQETINAQQDVKTAEQNRLAAEQRANQPPPDLRIAIFNCLNDQVKNGRDPAGCWGQIGGQPLVQVPR
ncbi:SPFH domain-containing protein [Mycobacterium scrofulaceum]|uniref:SPFH domain-containing protein n=1 Tax=Mycobacterium scrofulaceum TaxID=1783 RepID=UPI000AA7F2AE|nr:SPFH domain-containing protein [Mycobacterium scrofulaceum]